MLSTWIQSKKDEEGFTLIELLVVVIIIGILAAIAIPVFLNQRENAWRGAAESDARNAAIQAESVFTATDEYPDTATWTNTTASPGPAWFIQPDGTASTTAAATDIGEISLSTGVTLEFVNNGNTDYTITATHENLGATEIIYDSAAGGLADAWTPAAP